MTALVQVNAPPVLVTPVTEVLLPVPGELPEINATSNSLEDFVVNEGDVIVVEVVAEPALTFASMAIVWG